jgi:hypothetical protein
MRDLAGPNEPNGSQSEPKRSLARTGSDETKENALDVASSAEG